MMTVADAMPFLRAHECFRRDFARLRDLLASTRLLGEADRIALAEYWQSLSAVLEHHHENEDRVLFPRLVAAYPAAAAVVHELEEEHAHLGGLIAGINSAVDGVADPAQRRAAAGAARDLEAVVAAHLDAEERRLVPLFPRCFRRAEWAEMEGENTGELAKNGLFPFVLPWILEGMDGDLAELALEEFGAAAREAYHASWSAAYEKRCALLWQQ